MNTGNACQSQTSLIAHCKTAPDIPPVVEQGRITGADANEPLDARCLQ